MSAASGRPTSWRPGPPTAARPSCAPRGTPTRGRGRRRVGRPERAGGNHGREQAEPLLMPQFSPIMIKWAWWVRTARRCTTSASPATCTRSHCTGWNRPGEVTTCSARPGPPTWSPTSGDRAADRAGAGRRGAVVLAAGRLGPLVPVRTAHRRAARAGHLRAVAVRQILHDDQAEQVVYLTASGLVEEDPYRRTVCRAGLDGSGSPRSQRRAGPHRHMPDNQEYFIDSVDCRPPPVSASVTGPGGCWSSWSAPTSAS